MARTNKSENAAAMLPEPNATASKQGKEAVPGAVVQISEGGKTTIYPQVVAKIAGLAIREIEGVYRLVPFGAGQQVASLAKAVTRGEMKDLGVHVEVGSKEAAVDARIITLYGTSIPEVCDAIRLNVSDRIATMTGLKVVEVNVEVVDLYFPEEDEDVEEASPSRRVE